MSTTTPNPIAYPLSFSLPPPLSPPSDAGPHWRGRRHVPVACVHRHNVAAHRGAAAQLIPCARASASTSWRCRGGAVRHRLQSPARPFVAGLAAGAPVAAGALGPPRLAGAHRVQRHWRGPPRLRGCPGSSRLAGARCVRPPASRRLASGHCAPANPVRPDGRLRLHIIQTVPQAVQDPPGRSSCSSTASEASSPG